MPPTSRNGPSLGPKALAAIAEGEALISPLDERARRFGQKRETYKEFAQRVALIAVEEIAAASESQPLVEQSPGLKYAAASAEPRSIAVLRGVSNLLRRCLTHGLLRAETEAMLLDINNALSAPSMEHRLSKTEEPALRPGECAPSSALDTNDGLELYMVVLFKAKENRRVVLAVEAATEEEVRSIIGKRWGRFWAIQSIKPKDGPALFRIHDDAWDVEQHVAPASATSPSNSGATMNITVNGEPLKVEATSLSYEDVMKLAGFDPERIYSMTYSTNRRGDEQRSGILSPGRSVSIEEGMMFDAGDTSNA